VAKEKKVVEVSIDKGAPHGEKYTFHGEADEAPGIEAGDLVVVVDEQPHKVFKRRGADLLIEKEITLLESLTGINFVMNHLDGRKIRITSASNAIIKPGELKTIEGLGMPFNK
jgi:DnaJ-class molecular chaperone